jgi:O-antigen/teichoic acid export membrane protein
LSLKKNLLKNGLASAVQKIIKIAEQLLLIPFFISAWGAAYYGEWLTLTIIPTIIAFSDLGFGTAACNSFILKYAAGDKQGAANISKSGFLSIHSIVLAAILLSGIALMVLSYFNIFDKSLIARQDAILAVSFLMLARILGFYQPLNEAYFRAARRAALSINLMSVYSSLNLLVGLIVLLTHHGIVLYAFSNLVIALVYALVYTLIARKTLPIHKELKGRVLKADIVSIFHKGFGFLLSPVWQALFFQGTTFVVRIVLGPVAVTIFNTVRTLTRAVNQANAMVIASVLPELQYEMGAGNLPQARKIFRFGLIIITLIAVVGMLFLFIGGPWFYELWTRKALNPPAMMWNIFIIGILFSGAWWMASDVLIAANRPFDFTIAGVIVSAFAVLASYLLSIPFGLTGAAVGSLLLDLILFFYVLPRSCKLIEQPVASLIGDSIRDCKEMWKRRGSAIY